MCGDEKERVAGHIKMELRMPTTQFAHLRICLSEMAASFGRNNRDSKWSLQIHTAPFLTCFRIYIKEQYGESQQWK